MSKNAQAGRNEIHQAANCETPSLIMAPQSGVGGNRARDRNERVRAIVRIAEPTSRVASTTTGESAFGSIYRPWLSGAEAQQPAGDNIFAAARRHRQRPGDASVGGPGDEEDRDDGVLQTQFQTAAMTMARMMVGKAEDKVGDAHDDLVDDDRSNRQWRGRSEHRRGGNVTTKTAAERRVVRAATTRVARTSQPRCQCRRFSPPGALRQGKSWPAMERCQEAVRTAPR